MNFFIAALLVLRLSPGNAEVEDDDEEITQFLFNYMASYNNDLVEDYYYDNTTAMPTIYTYEMDSYETNTIWDLWLGFPEEDTTINIPEIPDTDAPEESRNAEDSQDFRDTAGSPGSPLRSLLPLVTLLSLLGLLL